MFKNMPWMVSRRRLLLLSIIDYSIIISTFLILENLRIINTNFLSINILAIFWIITSYTLDKYSIVDDEIDNKFTSKFLRTCKAYIITGILFKIIIIIFSFLKSDVGDGKWFIFLSIISSLSFLYEISHNFLVNKYITNRINWISIYSNSTNGSLLEHIKEVKKHGFYKSIHKSKLKELKNLNNKKIGFILEDINILSDEEKKILIDLKNEGFSLFSLIDWLERYLHRYPAEIISSENIIRVLLINKKSNTSKRIKRISEFILSLFLLIITAPIVLLISIFIKIEDRGPILYSQKRSGFAGQIFTIYKLRTMKINAEKHGIKWSSENDKRVTKIGKFLRMTRLDELPQLISVLKGDMSLIGPRPERPEIEKMLITKISNYKLRYLVRPGISGWAQVSYPYGASIEDTKMKLSYDIYYIKNFSTLFDFLILLETIRLVFNFRGSNPK